LKNRSFLFQSFCAQFFCGLLIAAVTVGLASCGTRYYKFPEYTFANRPVPPSKLDTRVMVALTINGTQGSLQILDAKRDIRSNIFDPNTSFHISGYASGFPNMIFNFPEQVMGYVYSNSDGSLTRIDYGKEAAAGSGGTLPSRSDSVAVPLNFNHVYAAASSLGVLVVIDNTTGRSFALNLPNVYKVAVNQGDTVVLAMVRNSNTLYRLIKLNANQPAVPGAVDCQPFNLPVYCVVPVPDSSTKPSLDRPVGAYFSLDGATAYVLNCGPECGGNASSLTLLQQGALRIDNFPTSTTYPSPVIGSVPVPGGATTVLSDGATLYIAGQQLLADGLFTGFLSTMDLASNTITGKYAISDGYHTKLLFGDDNSLWIGSQSCATGERAKLKQNYNCLTRFDLGSKAASIVPSVNPADANSSVPFPNANENQYYYGDLTGLCWIQNQHKMYTAYGGQVHAFNTADGSEIDNTRITIQGTALDVAYMDAITNAAN
jgi:hypothetical protein